MWLRLSLGIREEREKNIENRPMFKLKKTTFYILVTLSILGVILFGFGILNTMISFKYETEYGECISKCDGTNLCFQMFYCTAIAILSFVSFILLLIFRRKLCSSG